jgi:copper(I)-binding protein
MRQTTRILAALAALVTLLALAACGGSGDAGDGQPIEVIDPVASVTMEKGAVYFTIKNHTNESDWLTSVESQDAPTAELHETVTEGAAESMQPLERLEVPAGGETVLERGGVHVMLDGLLGTFQQGDVLQMDLHFEKAGVVRINPRITEYRGEPEPSPSNTGDMGR